MRLLKTADGSDRGVVGSNPTGLTYFHILMSPSHMGNAVQPQNFPNLLSRKLIGTLHLGQAGVLIFALECPAQTGTPWALYLVAVFPQLAHFIRDL